MKGFTLIFSVFLLLLAGVSSDTSLRRYQYEPKSILGCILEVVRTPFRILRFAVASAYDFLIRRPIRAVLKILDRTCQQVLRYNILGCSKAPNKRRMSLTLYGGYKEDSIPITDCEQLTRSRLYNKDKPVVIYIPGWLNLIKKRMPEEVNDLIDAYIKRKKENFVFFDFQTDLNSFYAYTTFNTKAVGKYLGECLAQIQNDLKDIHIIGASLGAQIAAAAAAECKKKTKRQIERITALDPSQPCEPNVWAKNGLNKNSAKFVVGVHTCKYLGTEKNVGKVDFFINSIDKLMPGCKNLVCSSLRATAYFAEAVLSEYSFLGVKCDSRKSFRRGLCDDNEKVFMGPETPHNVSGSFYMNARPYPPYGNNSTGIKPPTTTITSTESSAQTPTIAPSLSSAETNTPTDSTIGTSSTAVHSTTTLSSLTTSGNPTATTSENSASSPTPTASTRTDITTDTITDGSDPSSTTTSRSS